jgi:glucose/arabinose dehydrogenase
MIHIKHKTTIILAGMAVLFSLASANGFTRSALAADSAAVPKNVKFEVTVSGLSDPLFVTHAGDRSNRLFIVQRGGKILIFKNGALNSVAFLNVGGLITTSGSEQGLLGLAFDPNYATSGQFYIAYTAPSGAITLARYHVTNSDPDQADANSGEVLLSIPKPFSNHNGGMLAFGPDSYLYMSTGDGGSGGDPNNNGQSRKTLLGKILRLDVNSGSPYSIPPSNPFFNNPDPSIKKEIWAYGLRNPWRFSFDGLTGDLYIGDVGQNIQEEVDFQPAASTGGENYGWRILEGNLCYNSTNCTPPLNYVSPIKVYAHGVNNSIGCAVTGGYVYRGSNFPSLVGAYLYGDFCSGRLWGLRKDINNEWISTFITDTDYLISSFGEDEQGELYLTDYASGSVIHIAKAPVLSATFNSEAANDGYVIETSENSNIGGVTQPDTNLIRLGDQVNDRQIRALFSFNTTDLPDNATILSAVLQFRKYGIVGGDPFTLLGALQADIRLGSFGSSPTLESGDFQAPASRANIGGNLTSLPDNWYSLGLSRGSIFINKTGETHLRLRFTVDDNDNNANDYVNIYSGNIPADANKPKLIVRYFIP